MLAVPGLAMFALPGPAIFVAPRQAMIAEPGTSYIASPGALVQQSFPKWPYIYKFATMILITWERLVCYSHMS